MYGILFASVQYPFPLLPYKTDMDQVSDSPPLKPPPPIKKIKNMCI